MVMILWMIAGIIMFAITIFVHRHTLDWIGRPIKLKRWEYWVMFIIALIPIFNIIAFTIGGLAYIISFAETDITFSYKPPQWLAKLSEFLNQEV